jgi:LemA protein
MTSSSDREPAFGSSALLDPGLRQLLILFVIAVAVPGFCLAGCTYDVIPSFEQTAKASWSDVRNRYRGRLDLVQNLVAAVQENATKDKGTLTAVEEARARALSVDPGSSLPTDDARMQRFERVQADLSGALGGLLAASANDPRLISNKAFLALRSQVEGAEQRIAAARHGYVEAARRYNIALKVAPTLFWATTLFAGKRPMAEFTVKDDAAIAPPAKS